MLLPGQLWGMIVKERLQAYLDAVRVYLERELRPRDAAAELPTLSDGKWFRAALDKVGSASGDVGKRLEYFLATGNLVSESGLDLQQTAGFTIVAERLNYWWAARRWPHRRDPAQADPRTDGPDGRTGPSVRGSA